MLWAPADEAMASKVTGGVAADGVLTAVESGAEKRHFACVLMRDSFLVRSMA